MKVFRQQPPLAVLAAALLFLIAAPGRAAEEHKLAFLSADELQPQAILPAPPVDGSDDAAREVDELHRIADATSAERWDQANWDGEHEDGTIFKSAIAPGFDLAQLPATAKLLAEVRNEEAVAGGMAKSYFKRNRPWVVDPALKTCARGDAPQTSYPSGHATMAYAMAVVLARAMPDIAPQLLRRARDYSESRLICAAHFRSDIVAGQALGATVAVLLLRDSRFQVDLQAAKAELRAAHLTAN